MESILNIEKELERIWEKENQRVRASLFNLIFFSDNPKQTEYLRSFIPKIIAQFPCRIFFIEIVAAQNTLNVGVTKLISKEQSKAACEQIEIQASSDQMEKIPFLLVPNLIPDIPVHLFWGSDPTEKNSIFNSLSHIAKRVIFDSNCIDALPAFSQRMLRLIENFPNLTFVDLNWLMFQGWRHILPQIFDSQEEVDRLNYNNGIKILYNTAAESWCQNNATQALYFLLWLAECLQWVFVKKEIKEGETTFIFKNAKNSFPVVLNAQEQPECNSRSILGLEISTFKGCFYLISPLKDMPKVAVHVSTQEICEMPYNVSLPVLKKGFYSIRELFFAPSSEQYKKMLTQIAKIEKK